MLVKQETFKKIGFFTALSMLIGSVIGIGIFLKNGGIFELNGNNAIGIIISWSIGALIALTSAISFAEVGSSKKSTSGLAGWIEKFWGYKIGYFIKIVQPLFYMGLMMPILSFFSSESLILIFPNSSSIHFGWVFFLAFLLLLFFTIINFFSLKTSGRFSFITTILKFIPLLTIVIWGVVYAIQNQSTGFFDPSNSSVEKPINTSISATAILASLPSILFAFDSFANVGNLSLSIKKPDKNVPLVILFGLGTCSIFYILVTISQIFFMNGNSLDIFSSIIPNNENANFALSITLNIFITISILGVLNSFTATSLRSYNSLVDEKLIFCHSKVKNISEKIVPKFNSDIKSGLLISLFVNFFWFLIIGIPCVVKGPNGTDAYVDGISNFPTLFFFGVYGFVILGALINRFTKKVEVKKQKIFLFASPFAIIGSFLVFGYQIFYEYLYKAIENPMEIISWGLFFNNSTTVYRWEGMVFFFVSLLIFFALPFINYFLHKLLINKGNEPLKWKQ